MRASGKAERATKSDFFLGAEEVVRLRWLEAMPNRLGGTLATEGSDVDDPSASEVGGGKRIAACTTPLNPV
jgi:hypothetical protein